MQADLIEVTRLHLPLLLEFVGVLQVRSVVLAPGVVEVVLFGQAFEELSDALFLGFNS